MHGATPQLSLSVIIAASHHVSLSPHPFHTDFVQAESATVLSSFGVDNKIIGRQSPARYKNPAVTRMLRLVSSSRNDNSCSPWMNGSHR